MHARRRLRWPISRSSAAPFASGAALPNLAVVAPAASLAAPGAMLALAAFSLGAPTKHKKTAHALNPDASEGIAGYDKTIGGYGYCCLKAGATVPYSVEDCSSTGDDCRMQHDFPDCISWAGQCAVMKKDLKEWCDSTEGCGGGFCGAGYPNEGTEDHYCLMRSSDCHQQCLRKAADYNH